MRAIILAAGVGRRLGADADGPKCLLNFGGRTLLDRHLRNLAANNIARTTICVGYQREHIETTISDGGYENVETLFNDDYRAGSIVSLWTARDVLRSGEDIILMDADVLYTPAIMRALFKLPAHNRFLCDRNYQAGDEPVKICLRDGQIIEFRKHLAADLTYNDSGESVGFFAFTAKMAGRLADVTDSYVSNGRRDEPYEEAIRDLALASPNEFLVEDVSGLPWIEIDFPEDLTRAAEEILPHIDNR